MNNAGGRNSNVNQLKVSVSSGNLGEWANSSGGGAGQADDGFGSLPDTPTDFGRSGSHAAARPPPALEETCEFYAESIPTDDGIYTSSEEVGATIVSRHHRHSSPSDPPGYPPSSSPLQSSASGSSLAESGSSSSSCDTASERLSVISGEDGAEFTIGGSSNGSCRLAEVSGDEGRPGGRRSQGNAAGDRPRHHQLHATGQRERAVATKICTGSFSRGIERFRSESPAAVRGGGADS
jgi:hypothetical protein